VPGTPASSCLLTKWMRWQEMRAYFATSSAVQTFPSPLSGVSQLGVPCTHDAHQRRPWDAVPRGLGATARFSSPVELKKRRSARYPRVAALVQLHRPKTTAPASWRLALPWVAPLCVPQGLNASVLSPSAPDSCCSGSSPEFRYRGPSALSGCHMAGPPSKQPVWGALGARRRSPHRETAPTGARGRFAQRRARSGLSKAKRVFGR
jgi:hypothetical protein